MAKFSIITVCYNEPQLRRTCESIVNQTFQDFEWIVIDGGSNKETLDIFNDYKDRINIFVSEKDNGIYDGLNKGIQRASGKYLNFMNAGDCFTNKNILKKVNDFIDKNKNYSVITGYIKFSENNDTQGKIFRVPIKEFERNPIKWMDGGLPHQAMFFKRELFDKYGLYDLKYPVYSDWAKNIYFWFAGEKFGFIDKCIATFDHSGVSSNYWSEKNVKDRVGIIKEFFSEHTKHVEFKYPKAINVLYRTFRLFSFMIRPLRNYFRSRYKRAWLMIKYNNFIS